LYNEQNRFDIQKLKKEVKDWAKIAKTREKEKQSLKNALTEL